MIRLVALMAMTQTPVVAHQFPADTADTTSRHEASWVERFPVGERFVFDAKFGIISLGTATMEVVGLDTIRGVETLHLQFRLQGGLPFFKVNDVLDSWVGTSDFRSRRFTQDYREGSRERHRAWDIYPDSGFYIQESRPDTTFATVADPLDDAAFLYFVRTVDLEPGTRHEFDRYFRPDRNPVVVEVVARDTIDVPAGRFPAIVARPIIKGRGIFGDEANGRIWISDDERRSIVQIKTNFGFGTITLRLKEITTADATP